MRPVEIPTLRCGTWPGAFVEAVEMAGSPVWGVTVRPEAASTKRRFFISEREALAWAAGQADALGIGLFNISDPVGLE